MSTSCSMYKDTFKNTNRRSKIAPPQSVKKASQSLPPQRQIKSKTIFCRGVYLTENTSQAACVRVVRHRRTRSALSRLQSFRRKAPKGFFDGLRRSKIAPPVFHYFSVFVLSCSSSFCASSSAFRWFSFAISTPSVLSLLNRIRRVRMISFTSRSRE